MNIRTACLLALSAIVAPLAANAAPTGDSVQYAFSGSGTGSCNCTYDGPGSLNPGGSVVLDLGTVSYSGSQISITFSSAFTEWLPATFNGLVLTDLDGYSITPVFDSSSTASNFSSAPLTVVGDTTYFNFEGLSFTPGQTVTYDLTFTPTPEPGSLALLGTGLLGVAAVGRRKFFAL